MSVTYISVELRRLVENRAGQRCEYCLLPSQAEQLLNYYSLTL
jgi:hypothetical protein